MSGQKKLSRKFFGDPVKSVSASPAIVRGPLLDIRNDKDLTEKSFNKCSSVLPAKLDLPSAISKETVSPSFLKLSGADQSFRVLSSNDSVSQGGLLQDSDCDPSSSGSKNESNVIECECLNTDTVIEEDKTVSVLKFSLETFLIELKWLLLGIQGDLFFETESENCSESEFTLKEGVTLEGIGYLSFQSSLSPVLCSGANRNKVWSFVTLWHKSSKHCFQAVSLVLRETVLEYDKGIGKLFDEYQDAGYLQILFVVEPHVLFMKALAGICQNCGTSSIKLLESLFNICCNCPNISSIHRTAVKLFQGGLGPFLKFLNLWTIEGWLADSEEEFFVYCDFDAFKCRDRKYWKSAFSLRRNNIPKFLCRDIANDLFVSGKTVNLLQSCGVNTKISLFTSTEETEKLCQSNTHADYIRDFPRCAAKINWKSSDSEFLCLETKSPVGPQVKRWFNVLARSRKSELRGLVTEFLFKDSEIRKTIEEVRDVFLCNNGRFSALFCESIFRIFSTYTDSGSCFVSSLSAGMLQSALSTAFEDSGLSSRTYSRCKLFVRDVPGILDFRSTRILDFLELKYDAPWPANLIMTPACLEHYEKIFRLLCSIQWVQVNLNDLLDWLKENAAALKPSGDLIRLHMCRTEMCFFLTCLQEYLSNQVLSCCWKEFRKDLDQIGSLDEMHLRHKSYLSSVVTICILNSKAEMVAITLTSILGQMLKFRAKVVSRQPFHDFSDAFQIYGVFRSYTKHFLFKLLKRLANSGYEPKLEALLLRLNFNNYFENCD